MYNLRTVFSFEFIRTIKKKSFWIMSLLFPVIIGVVFAIEYFSNETTIQATEDIASQVFSIEIIRNAYSVKPQQIFLIKNSAPL